MKVLPAFAAIAIALSACAAPNSAGNSGNSPESDASAVAGRDSQPATAAPSEPAEIPVPPAPTPVPDQRQPTDLAPCPGINPDIRRPAGSNCLGILPSQCGADRAQGYVGQKGTTEARDELRELALDGSIENFRWIPFGTAVNDDLRPFRMNVEMDRNGVITKVDCY